MPCVLCLNLAYLLIYGYKMIVTEKSFLTISATDILVPVCSKIPLLYLLTQKVAQKFGYVLGIGKCRSCCA